ncbi:hypothetical protein TspCOW1_15380 [Thiohalobacter sp. COW1]|uniref:Hemin uptake protein n=1 Tax=Thiohalobacter thiocyanaticus TaxID=585455 RepID=A0A1Z4VPW0_9GAMM|nr:MULTISPECIES: hemin uptake protein HemP [Thiohalobacter]BAZ93523.1 hemin uptake protein [Thiohalobacter thiocyanaticus]BCO31435.1 hypothetical protein TspCOW1_15380 [Thiohalobacter sp. COW1]
MNDKKQPDSEHSPAPATSGKAASARINSVDLFKGNRHLVIEHGDEEYRLQQTSNGKLILTK